MSAQEYYTYLNMIPYPFLSKMGNYEVTVHGYKVEVSVVTDVRLFAGKISERMTFLETRRVVGLDFKFDRYNETLNSYFFVLEIAAWLSQRLTVSVAPYVIVKNSVNFSVLIGILLFVR